jgi:hypothetical protein
MSKEKISSSTIGKSIVGGAIVGAVGHYDLLYDGTHLHWRALGASYNATSGDESHQKPEFQCKTDMGPIPEGKFRVALKLGGFAYVTEVFVVPQSAGQLGLKYDTEFSIENMPTNVTFGNMTDPFPPSFFWGCHRVRLEPVDPRSMCSRDGFYIHDSVKGYTKGCIETEHQFFVDLIRYAQTQNNPAGRKWLVLLVDYSAQRKPGGSGHTLGQTKVPVWSPSTIPGNVDRDY